MKGLRKLSLMVGLCLPVLSYAQSPEGIINKTVTYLQGGLARAVGILCIIITGYLCLVLNKFPKENFILVLVGMGIIFGATSLYSTLIA